MLMLVLALASKANNTAQVKVSQEKMLDRFLSYVTIEMRRA